jgi:hypothetical protein
MGGRRRRKRAATPLHARGARGERGWGVGHWVRRAGAARASAGHLLRRWNVPSAAPGRPPARARSPRHDAVLSLRLRDGQARRQERRGGEAQPRHLDLSGCAVLAAEWPALRCSVALGSARGRVSPGVCARRGGGAGVPGLLARRADRAHDSDIASRRARRSRPRVARRPLGSLVEPLLRPCRGPGGGPLPQPVRRPPPRAAPCARTPPLVAQGCQDSSGATLPLQTAFAPPHGPHDGAAAATAAASSASSLSCAPPPQAAAAACKAPAAARPWGARGMPPALRTGPPRPRPHRHRRWRPRRRQPRRRPSGRPRRRWSRRPRRPRPTAGRRGAGPRCRRRRPAAFWPAASGTHLPAGFREAFGPRPPDRRAPSTAVAGDRTVAPGRQPRRCRAARGRQRAGRRPRPFCRTAAASCNPSGSYSR